MERLISFFGLFAMMGFAWMLSSNRRRIPVRVIVLGVSLQLVFGLIVLKTAPGQAFFDGAKNVVEALLSCVEEGTQFMFKELGLKNPPTPNGPYFAFYVLSTIIFFASFMKVLYHFGVMQRVIEWIAVVMHKTMGTSGAESLSAAANIFVGQTEAPLVIGPYVKTMTSSELMAVMVGGFATVAGGVLAAYASFGIDAGHLLTASVISAPAALVVAKILQPETEVPQTLGKVEVKVKRETVNAIDAAARGASEGLFLALNVGAMLIAFLAIIAVLEGLVGWTGDRFEQEWSFHVMLGYAFSPFAWLMGVEWNDCFRVGQLLGTKMMTTEFIAYIDLATLTDEADPQISERSATIATYALCGFANFSSIGIQLGGISSLAPERRGDLARLGLRAMLGGTLAAFMTACVAGMLL
jgi:CNT family concentrative nucleoside transporter